MSTTETQLETVAIASPAAIAAPPRYDLPTGAIDTHISRRLAWVTIILFLSIIFAIPVAQAVIELVRGGRVHFAEVLQQWPSKQSNRQFESRVEDASLLRGLVRPQAAAALLRLGFANGSIVKGKDGWLYYSHGVEYATGRGFLREDVLDQRTKSAQREDEDIYPDPRLAILQFNRYLARRGIRLVLIPVADKAMVETGPLHGAGGFVNNPDYGDFVEHMRAAGIDVVDMTPTPESQAAPHFLKHDTHWTPQWMQEVAADLARHIQQLDILSPSSLSLKTIEQDVTNVGDLARMLELHYSANLFPPQTVRIQRVYDARTNTLWQSAPGADVLLLGDSFANIYSEGGMGWGEGAGLAEQLSRFLQRPIDAIVRNDGGAAGSREALSAELARGRDRLAGKKVVIWEFAMRELACGDWRPVEMIVAPHAPGRALNLNRGQQIVVTGIVEERSALPRPGVPYRDHIMAVILENLSPSPGTPGEGRGGGEVRGSRAMVYLWSMRDAHFTPAARLRIGQRIKMRICNWDDVSGKLDRINRSEVSDQSLMDSPCWGELIE